jgi:hypothetical protein
MNIDELKTLVPFYVGGALDTAKRMEMEEALKSSEELRNELRFWERTKTVVDARVAHAAAGHLTPKQIVDRAMGAGSGDELLSFDRHLQLCAECSEEFRRVKESLGAREAVEPTLFERMLGRVRVVRLVYAVPALIVVIGAVVLYFGKTNKQPPGPIVPGMTPPTIAEAPVDDTASLWLTYRPEVRSASRQALPSLILGAGKRQTKVFVAVPQNRVSGIQYGVTITSPGKKPYHLDQLLQRYATGGGYDSLQFVLPREVLPPTGTNMNLTISEVLPPALHALSPEEYRFEIEMKAKR